MNGSFLRSCTIDRGNNTALITLDAEEDLSRVWEFSMDQNRLNRYESTLPLMNRQRFQFSNFGLVYDCSRAHSDIVSTPVHNTTIQFEFFFKVRFAVLRSSAPV